MKISFQKTQSGFALLIFLVLMMGIGGFLLTGYSQGVLKEVETKKFEHNQRVLKEAKQALLQFAYNYPTTNSNGPGRLPCPDINNDGSLGGVETLFTCSSNLGRLPWNHPNINLYDIRDADGQRLWYAVSDNFSTQDAANLNSDTFGTINVRGQSGNVIYDGSHPLDVAKSGVAAVIIAPGAITSRNGVSQNRSVIDDDPFDTVIDDDPGVILATNYLDLVVGVEDNADFTLDSAVDGFILGPVNSNTINAVNDQIIVITAAEVIEVAEKATLQAYRTAINDYLNVASGCFDASVPPILGIETTEAACNITGSPWRWINVYPWLYNYTGVPDVPGLSSYYPANISFAAELGTNLGNFGRIPSIFQDYFTKTNSEPIQSKLSGTIAMSYPRTPITVGHTGGGSDFEFNDGIHTLNFQTVNVLTDVQFVDIAGPDGRLTGTVGTFESFTHVTYFWDDGDSPTGIWTMCLAGADDLSDCNRNGAGIPDPFGSNATDSEILKITLTMELDPGVVEFDADYTTPPGISQPTAASNLGHAWIEGTFDGDDVDFGNLPTLEATFEHDDEYDVGESVFVSSNSGDLDDVADLIFDSLILGLRYYPVLPDWAFDNDWHNSVMMAYANDYRPDVLGLDCATNLPCIQINGMGGINNDKVSILAIAGENKWEDGSVLLGVAADGSFADELGDVFNLVNATLDNLFDIRTVENTAAPGDTQLDKILVIN